MEISGIQELCIHVSRVSFTIGIESHKPEIMFREKKMPSRHRSRFRRSKPFLLVGERSVVIVVINTANGSPALLGCLMVVP
jgi:hypothetical protein